MKRLVISTALLAAAAFGQITGEHPVSTPVYGPVPRILQTAIASDGDGFLAVWTDQRDYGALYAARIARDGTIADPRGILLAKTLSSFAVAWTGGHYLAVWNDVNSIIAADLDRDGRLLAAPRTIVTGALLSNAAHPIASNGSITVLMTSSGYSVLDREETIVEQGRFGESAFVTGTGEFVLTAAFSSRHLDAAGHYVTSKAVGWQRPIACRPNGCLTALQTSSGKAAIASYDPAELTVAGITELPIAVTDGLDLVATADGYLLETGALAQRLDDDGKMVGSPIALPAASGSVQASSNGRDVAVLRNSGTSLGSFVITPTGVTAVRAVAESANAQRDVAIAKSDTNYLTVWAEKDGTYAGRLSLDGQPLDGRGLFLGSSTTKPNIVFDGTSYLVILAHPFSVAGAQEDVVRIDPASGAVIAISTIAGTNLRIASNGSARVAAWIDSLGAVETAFLDPNGALASTPVWLAVPPTGNPFTTLANLSLAWNGTIWFVTWEEQIHPLPIPGPPLQYPYVVTLPSIAIRGVRLSSALTPLDTRPITVATTRENDIRSSHLASDGKDFLAAWSTDRIHVRRVSASGVPDSETQLAIGNVHDLVWDGVDYDLAFATGRQPFTPFTPGDLAIAQLTSSGQLLETLVISATPGDDRSASLVPIGIGHVLAAYTRVAYEPLYAGVERVFVTRPHQAHGRPTR